MSIAEHGRLPKKKEKQAGFGLGNWLFRQRNQLSPETDEEKIAKLKELGAY